MAQNNLFNRKNKNQLIQEYQEETFNRKTCSFYRYVKIANPQTLRNVLYKEWLDLNVLGRVYLATEGINAQISVPEPNWKKFIINLEVHQELLNMHLKIAVKESEHSFLKLIIRIKNKIVADGIDDETFDSSNVGTHLNAEQFNTAMEDSNTVVVDMRNYYESEVGHFDNAICPDVDTFKDALPYVKDQLTGKEDHKILLYCTGGIRCEKASAYLKHHNFRDVNQLNGGIIEYSHQIKKMKSKSKFIGKNFVFDYRMSEAITDDIISNCHQCDAPSSRHTNCENQACHILFIQCQQCSEKFENCCSEDCNEINQLSINEQRLLRKDPSKAAPLKQFQERVKPKLKDLMQAREETSQHG
tara:strand:+ start:554 stop:1627 length:1074 start_codon:yes stop_codon:yes gene_type:complete